MMFTGLFDTLRKTKSSYKAAFLGTFLFGILSQGMGLFNKYCYHDEALALFGVGRTYDLGRWMLDILARAEVFFFRDGHFSLPLVNGAFSMLCIALSACLIFDLLEMKNDYLCFLTAGVMVTFPVITSTFAFMYTAPYYLLAVFLGVLGLYLICRNPKRVGLPVGILLIACSIGIYQAYYPLLAAITLIYFLQCILQKEESTGVLLKHILLTGISLILSMVVYLVINILYLKLLGAELMDYRGISSMGANSLGGYLSRIMAAYHEFFFPYKNRTFNMFPHTARGLYFLILALILVLAGIKAVSLFRRDRGKALLFMLVLLLFPLGSNFIFFMTDWDTVHSLMVYGQVAVFILFAALADRSCQMTWRDAPFAVRSLQVISLLALLGLNILYIRFDNRCYLKAELAQQQTISYFTTLITQIKSVDGYTDEMPVVTINPTGKSDDTLPVFEELLDIKTLPYYGVTEYVNNYTWKNFMEIWCGFSPVYGDPNAFKDLPEVKEMPSYPDDGSIRVINHTVVVKF